MSRTRDRFVVDVGDWEPFDDETLDTERYDDEHVVSQPVARGPANRNPWVFAAEVFQRDMHACVRCGATDGLSPCRVDPSKPSSVRNLRTLCQACIEDRQVADVPPATYGGRR